MKLRVFLGGSSWLGRRGRVGGVSGTRLLGDGVGWGKTERGLTVSEGGAGRGGGGAGVEGVATGARELSGGGPAAVLSHNGPGHMAGPLGANRSFQWRARRCQPGEGHGFQVMPAWALPGERGHVTPVRVDGRGRRGAGGIAPFGFSARPCGVRSEPGPARGRCPSGI
jgi:hypothetical protein